MAKERITRRLKVYTTRIGINDWAVAVPSQKEALKAWDVRENLFASGAARVVDDPAVIVAALESPGVPVAVPVNAKAHVAETKSNVVQLHERRAARAPVETKKPVVERRPEPKKLVPNKAERRAPPPPPDRSRLDTAEQELREFDIEIKVRRKELARRKQELEREMESFETDTDTRRRRLERQVERARQAYERAKGA